MVERIRARERQADKELKALTESTDEPKKKADEIPAEKEVANGKEEANKARLDNPLPRPESEIEQ
jgi:hypothetical protein